MKIVLLNTPFLSMYSRASRSPAVTKSSTLYYPIWLAYATGLLEKEGHDVKLIDAPAYDYSRQDVYSLVQGFAPDMVVVDTTTPSIYNDLEIASEIKSRFNPFTVLVGTHASALPRQVLKDCPGADAVARGEYDFILKDLANSLSNNYDISEVKGLTFRQDGEVFDNPEMPKIEDLDSIPFVSGVYKRHLEPVITKYFYGANRHPVVTILSGRGCPYRCCYCVYPQVMLGHKYRYRSVKDVVDEMEYIQEAFPYVREIFLEDDTLTVNRKRTYALCEEILRRNLKIVWSTNSRAQVDYDTLRIMRKSGCRLLCVGYESGDQNVLDSLGKNISLKEIYDFTKNAKKAGILVHGCFLVGNPGETKQSLEKTIKMAKELNPDTAQFYPIMVYPGTRAYNWARENNYLLTEDYSQWLNQEGLHYCVVSKPDLSRDDLVAWCDRARREFYLRPGYIFSKIFQGVTKPSEFTRLFRGFKSLIRFLVTGTK